MVDYGMKISKAGYDVKSCADKNLAISSEYATLKVYMQGSSTLDTSGDGLDSTIITHNLNYKPLVLVYCDDEATNAKRRLIPRAFRFTDDDRQDMWLYITDTELKVWADADNTNSWGTVDFYYYIFYDPA